MKQTTEIAIDMRRGSLIHSHMLLDMSEVEYNDFERDFQKYRIENHGQSAYRCGICEQSVHLGRRESSLGENRFFVHDAASACPWYTGLSDGELLERSHYMALRESPRHRSVLDDLLNVIASDPDWRDVQCYRFKIGLESCRTPKVADIHGYWRDRLVAFEIQTDSTRLPDSIVKDMRVSSQGGTLIWLFRELTGSTQESQEAIYNQRNLFTWNARNVALSTSFKKVMLTANFEEPKVDETTRLKSLEKRSEDVDLSSLTFSTDRPRAFYFDFAAADLRANAEMPMPAFRVSQHKGARYRVERPETAAQEPINWDSLFQGPIYQWAPIDEKRVSNEMAFYTVTHKETDWEGVLAALTRADRPTDVREALKIWSVKFHAREGDLKNFLVRSGCVTSQAQQR